jgi:integrase
VTGKRKRKWVTVKGKREAAQTKLTELLRSMDTNAYVDTSKLTVGEWLEEWFATAQTTMRPATISRYRSILDSRLLKAPLASLLLQKLRPFDIETYYKGQKAVSNATLALDHAILHRALRKALKNKLVVTNAASELDERPRASGNKSDEAREHAWSVAEASAFLDAAKRAGAQAAAFYALALGTGMRKSELGGLRWANVDLESGKVQVVEQLTRSGKAPEWGPTKTGRPRTLDIDRQTVLLLREHRRVQAELKMKNRAAYADYGLVFAKDWSERQRTHDVLGQLQLNNIGERQYARLIKEAGVRRIKFHGLRHTCATLLLAAGTPVHVVSERLGHSKVSMTMEVYAHVLPGMQADAASTLGALLHR